MSNHSLGIILSIFGVWFSSIGIIGKKRLERWESLARQRTIKLSDLPNTIKKWLEGNKGMTNFLATLPFTCFLVFAAYLAFWDQMVKSRFFDRFALIGELLCTITIASPFFAFTYPFWFPLLVWTVVAIMTLPYRVVSKIESENALERTFLFLGAISGTLGIVLMG